MSGNSQYSTATRNASADAIAALLNLGKLRLYDGAQPANANVAVSTQNLLAEFTFPTPAFGASVSGVATANAIPNVSVSLGGKATWFRAVKADGSVICDGNLGGGASVTLSGGASASAVSLAVTALTFPVFAGTVLPFPTVAGTVYAAVTVDAAIGATAITVTALSGAIASGAVAGFNCVMNAAQLILGATASITSLTITAAAAGT